MADANRPYGMSHIGGGRPTYPCGSTPRAEAADFSAAGDWPWGENQGHSTRSGYEVVRQWRACWVPIGGVRGRHTHPPGGDVWLVSRTNNLLEGFNRALKQGERRRSGHKILSNIFEHLQPEAALARNLVCSDYVEILCGSLERLPQAFAGLDAERRRRLLTADQPPVLDSCSDTPSIDGASLKPSIASTGFREARLSRRHLESMDCAQEEGIGPRRQIPPELGIRR